MLLRSIRLFILLFFFCIQFKSNIHLLSESAFHFLPDFIHIVLLSFVINAKNQNLKDFGYGKYEIGDKAKISPENNKQFDRIWSKLNQENDHILSR